MNALADVLAAIEAGPSGPAIAAFFDFDGTLIDGYSATAYVADRARRGEMNRSEAADVARLALHGDMDEPAFATSVGKILAPWAGRPEQDFADLWQRLFRQRLGTRLFPGAWALVKAHQRKGHTVVIATSATTYQVMPAAAELGIVDVLCTRAVVRDGLLTGEVERPTPWGAGKAAAVRAFATRRGLDLSLCHGYANGDEDIDFLRAVGHPAVVNPGRRLAAVAEPAGWPVLRFAPRRTTALSKVRTVAAYGSLAGVTLGGVAYAAVTGRRRRAAEQVLALGSDAMLAVSGIRVEVEGREHLQGLRSSVLLFNHQSHLDAYVLIKLVRRDYVGIAKKEAARMPFLGQLMRAMEFVFLDRGDHRAAVDALRPAVDRLKTGLNVAIAPEGTRSLTARLLPFKKGGFHIALQAGAPLVPMVLHNTWEVVPRDSMMFRPGTVRVTVLPPVDTTGWRREDLDRHIAEVRQRFQETLDRGFGARPAG